MDLNVNMSVVVNNLQPLQLANALCPSLTSVRLQFSSLSFPEGTDELLHPLIHSLDMPNLINLDISLELIYDDLLRDDEDSNALCDLVLALLPDPDTHAKLSSLSVELLHTKGTKEPDWGDDHIENKRLVIPLDQIPHVSTLSVKAFGQLHFSHSNGLDGDRERPCALRDLRIHDCERYGISFLEQVIASLKSVGAWNKLQSFRVERCVWKYERVLTAVGAERLDFIKKEGKFRSAKSKPLADF